MELQAFVIRAGSGVLGYQGWIGGVGLSELDQGLSWIGGVGLSELDRGCLPELDRDLSWIGVLGYQSWIRGVGVSELDRGLSWIGGVGLSELDRGCWGIIVYHADKATISKG